MQTDTNTEWTTTHRIIYEHILTRMLELSRSCDVTLDGVHSFHVAYPNDPTTHLVIEVDAEPIGAPHHTQMLQWTLTGWTQIDHHPTNRVPFTYGPHVTNNSIEALAAFMGWTRSLTA